MTLDQHYYVRRQGRVEGPWQISKLQSEVKLKRLARYHEVSIDGKQWEPATSIADLFKKTEARKVLGGLPTPQVPKQENETEEKWYCNCRGNQRGPMPKEELGQLITVGQLRLDDLVWREGFPDWIPLEDVPELMQLYSPAENAGDLSGQTEATRLVQLPVSNAKNSRLPWIAVISGGGLFVLSCIPIIGLLGIIPVGIGAYSAYQIQSSKQGDLRIAILGTALGFAALMIGVASLVISGFYLLNSGN